MPAANPIMTLSGKTQAWQRVLLLMICSAAALTWAHWRYVPWVVTPKVYIDPWIYWGTGEDIKYFANNLGLTYYFRRWTLVFPNYVFQHLFSPYMAQFLLRS